MSSITSPYTFVTSGDVRSGVIAGSAYPIHSRQLTQAKRYGAGEKLPTDRAL